MAYALLKTVHLLAIVAWLGGMFFVLSCLRPSLGVLEGPARLRLMRATLGRFFRIVSASIGLMLLSGLGMLWILHRARGSLAGLPVSWTLMFGLGLVMMAVFEYVRGVPFKRMKAALEAQDSARAVTALARIRGAVALNLGLGVLIVVAMKLVS